MDGSTLQMISGYNPEEEEWTLSSIQFLTTDGSNKEASYPTLSRLAAAVTLSTGSILVTGGRVNEKQVWMSASNSSTSWVRKKDMLEGRKGHAAAAVMLADVEVVIVAGGWSFLAQELASVELYRPKQDQWSRLTSMPKARVDFALKVKYFQKCVPVFYLCGLKI